MTQPPGTEEPGGETPARVTAELVDGRVRLGELRASRYLQPRPLGSEGPAARVALVGRYAMLLAGDDLHIDIRVGPGVHLEIVEPSGTVAYDARGGSARWSASVRVADGGCLVWRSAPFVVTQGADLTRDTRVDVEPGGRALISESLVLGRSYERGCGPLFSRLRGVYAGRPLLAEDLDLRDALQLGAPGILGGARALRTIMLFGARPDEARGRHESLLAGTGAMARAIALHAHEAEDALADTWLRWSAWHAAGSTGNVDPEGGAGGAKAVVVGP